MGGEAICPIYAGRFSRDDDLSRRFADTYDAAASLRPWQTAERVSSPGRSGVASASAAAQPVDASGGICSERGVSVSAMT